MCLNAEGKINFRRLFHTHPILKDTHDKALKYGSKILVLIPKWNGIRTTSDHFFYWDPHFSTYAYRNVHAIHHSELVKKAAVWFQKVLNIQPPTIGVHIRLERLMKSMSLNQIAIMKCLKIMVSTVKSLQTRHRTNSSVMFRDYGVFGSSTCKNKHCSQFAKGLKLEQTMKTLGVTVAEFNPKATGFPEEAGFSSNVEQEVLSRADFLVLVGYGSFQQGIAGRFLREEDTGKGAVPPRHQKRIFRICSS